MRLTANRWIMLSLALGLLGCDGESGTDAGVDAGGGGDPDAGCPMPLPLPEGERPDPSTVTCPEEAPFPDEQMGSCCWRHSNADQPESPEMRLTYLRIVAPIGSTLASTTLTRVLNESMQDETFNWLFRAEGPAEGDGPVTITTGFGRRQADGTYMFSSGMAPDNATWCPVEIAAEVTGATVRSQPIEGSITVPIFDDTGESLQVELTLRQIAIAQATYGEDRSCVGWKTGRPFTYHPEGMLTAFIEVEPARTGVISVPPVETSVCAAIAGSLNDGSYCDTPQSEWETPPDSLCDETGCQANSPCMSDVCDPATTCNAWRLVAHFAAAGVDITNGLCGE